MVHITLWYVVFFRDQGHQQIARLETELQTVKEERDDALLRMTNAQQQADMNADSIRNLQSVLEHFEKGA